MVLFWSFHFKTKVPLQAANLLLRSWRTRRCLFDAKTLKSDLGTTCAPECIELSPTLESCVRPQPEATVEVLVVGRSRTVWWYICRNFSVYSEVRFCGGPDCRYGPHDSDKLFVRCYGESGIPEEFGASVFMVCNSVVDGFLLATGHQDCHVRINIFNCCFWLRLSLRMFA